MEVKAPDGNGNWRRVMGKDEIIKSCLEENIQSFTQANETPFMQQPLLEEVGRNGMTPHAKQILDGTYDE